MQSQIKFFGSANDLAELRSELIANGIKEHEDNIVRASEKEIRNMVNSQVLSVSFAIIKGIGSAIKHYLTAHGKRMVTRETHGEKITIKGDFTVEEIERLLKISHAFDVEDDADKPTESNKESEMGFHVGRDKPKKL